MDTPAWIFALVLLAVLIELTCMAVALSRANNEKKRLSEDRSILALELARYRVQGSDAVTEAEVAENILGQLRPRLTETQASPHTGVLAHIFPR